MTHWPFLGAAVLFGASLITFTATAQERKEPAHGHLAPVLEIDKQKEQRTQRLEVPRDPPAVQTGDPRRLEFHVSPLSGDGILSKQARNSLRALLKRTRRNRIVHLRAFVAGSGDTRRVQDVVSEVFTERKAPLPSLSVVQIGVLPAPTAQVVIEAVSESPKTINPGGIAFISGQSVASGEAVLEVADLARQAVEKIRSAASSINVDPPQDVLRVTCFCSSLADGREVRHVLAKAFPRAALNYVQLRRVYTRAAINCEAVARLQEPAARPLAFENPDNLARSGDYSQIALVSADRLAFSGTQIAFRHQDEDVRLAFDRLNESLSSNGASFETVAYSRFYTLSGPIGDSIRRLRFDYFSKEPPPANTLVELEGLPSLDASFAMDVIAVPQGN